MTRNADLFAAYVQEWNAAVSSAANPVDNCLFIEAADTGYLDILNYALTLEHLETKMYKQIVASGKLTGDEQQYAEEIGKHEAAHVQALTGAIQKLGGTPVARQKCRAWN